MLYRTKRNCVMAMGGRFVMILSSVFIVTSGVAMADGAGGEGKKEQQIVVCHQGKTKIVEQKDRAKHQAHGDAQGVCPDESKMVVCHNGELKLIKQKDWPKHEKHGDQKDSCDPINEVANPGYGVVVPPQATTPVEDRAQMRGKKRSTPRPVHHDTY